MLYRTHVVSSLAVGTALVVATDYPFSADLVGGIMIGSVLPDIDEPNSFMGRRSLGLSLVINRLFGHRGFTHSLVCWMFVTTICLLFSKPFTIGISLGFFLHILGDLFSTSGLRLFLPFSNKRVKMLITYKTGSSREQIILYVCAALIVYLFLQNERLPIELAESTASWFIYFINLIRSILSL